MLMKECGDRHELLIIFPSSRVLKSFCQYFFNFFWAVQNFLNNLKEQVQEYGGPS